MIEPMRADEPRTSPPDLLVPGRYSFEPKWDGYRCIAVLDRHAKVSLRSRSGRSMTSSFPDVAAALRTQIEGPGMLDGELVVWRDNRLDFAGLQRRASAGGSTATRLSHELPAAYIAFDLLRQGEEDLRALPYRMRRQRLQALLAGVRPPVELTPATTSPREALLWYEHLTAAGVEGLVVKELEQPYRSGQGGWLKVRHRRTTEVLVGAVAGEVARPTRVAMGAYDEQGDLKFVGSTTPLPAALSREVGAAVRTAAGGHPWAGIAAGLLLGGMPGQGLSGPVRLVEPSTVLEVSVDTAFERGRWRHPVKPLRMRTDVTPQSVTSDSISAIAATPAVDLFSAVAASPAVRGRTRPPAR